MDDRGRAAGRQTLASFEASMNVGLDYDRLVDRRRSQRRNRTMALVASAVVAVFAIFLAQSSLSANTRPQPMKPVPGLDIGDVPVWYDSRGLHRGDVVEQTAVDLAPQVGPDIRQGALALVRTGAVYLDPATGDVWFHPWGGDPRIVGHNSNAGPGGDPNGDIAVWFEESEFVVYDTAIGSELSRTELPGSRPFPPGSPSYFNEHIPIGNGYTQVSSQHVAWTYGGRSMTFYDPETGQTSGSYGTYLDVHDDASLSYDDKQPTGRGNGPASLILKESGQAAMRYPELEQLGLFSPSGQYVLAVGDSGTHETHGVVIRSHDVVIIHTATGDLWPIPRRFNYPWIAWSYGDVAMVNFGGRQQKLLACDAAQHTCETLPIERPILMPKN